MALCGLHPLLGAETLLSAAAVAYSKVEVPAALELLGDGPSASVPLASTMPDMPTELPSQPRRPNARW